MVVAGDVPFRSCEKPRHATAVFATGTRNTAIWGETGGRLLIIVVASSHFRTQVGLPKKVPLAVLLKSTRPSYDVRFCSCPCPPEARQKKSTPGALPATSRQLHLEHPVCFFAVKQATAGFKCNNFQPGQIATKLASHQEEGKSPPRHTPGRGFLSRDHGHLFYRKIVGVFVSLI